MNQSVPSLRFPEFNDEWKVSPLCEVFDRVKEKNSSLNTNVLTISGQDGLVSQNKYFTKSVASKDTSGYYLLSRGDFAYNKSYSKGYPMGAIKRLKFSDSGVVSPLYICFRTNSDFDGYSEFFEHQFESGRLNKSIYRIAQEGARNHGLLNVSVNEFFIDVGISYPCNLEQNKIADFFNVIDIKISHLIAKHRLLKEYKKGVMQQIFSQQIRFKDENGVAFPDWKEHALKEILLLQSDSLSMDDEETYELITVKRGFGGVKSRGHFKGKDVLVKNQFTIHENEFVISKRQIVHGACGLVPSELDGAIVSNEYNVFRPVEDLLDIDYFNRFTTTPFMRRSFFINSDGVHIEKLLFKTQGWLKTRVHLPCLEEQQKITQFLKAIDIKIEGVAEQIEHTKQFKKGLLQQMFV
ncbi:Type I restriction modification DNA specificity domain [Vibrio sp. B1ASS3]|uniref:restriction endonuclease subunit S n=1 Tax=Vibrio sp. B1ASS3 TaxID=2751176 RepID=UPI001ABBCE7A|nr:restriction endonuclease subunit S [Vibrio sp. B1ASS3]CAD7817941.1 Type I restriction modification DNA specificity domain [Vibrio sp. B1ASS3]CAE6932909.1 Type I restriction modification DNA specificity domain [Vibrio sp. B1ASS3]